MDTKVSTDVLSSTPSKEQLAIWDSLTHDEQTEVRNRAIEEARNAPVVNIPSEKLEEYIKQQVLQRRAQQNQ